jgi:formylglycine-generating enzyme required for sulfatase activity
VAIPAGDFIMGSPLDEEGRHLDERQHRVTISQPFLMGVHEVTQEQFENVWGINPSQFQRGGSRHEHVVGLDTVRFPVEGLAWESAAEFCQRLSDLPAEKAAGRVYSLPTEAQWEYACRAGTTTPFSFGDAANGRESNVKGIVGYGGASPGVYLDRPTEVGSYEPNAFGLYDMHGNVWEWCQDMYGTYPIEPVVDPVGNAGGSGHVLRGGSWFYGPGSARSAHRSQTQALSMGLRVVCTIRPSLTP